MNAATRKLVDQHFTTLRRTAERMLAEAEAAVGEWVAKTNTANAALDNQLEAAQAVADALFIAQAIALGAIAQPMIGT